MPVDAANAKSIFLAALEKSDHAERAGYLNEACAGDDGLRARVNALLSAHESGSFPDFVADAAPAFEATQSVISTPNDATLTAGDAPHSDGRSLSFLDPPREPGNLGRLDHYEVQSVLGQGGMGIVLKAFDESLDRVVAIKVLGAQYAANGTARRRFIREAKAVAAVAHEHVVHVYAVNERVPYLVMQYIKGVSLQDRIDKSGPLELKEILRIGMQIASGLAAAHAQGIVHRDIKPSNILLENGIERVKLTDFGLARAVDDASVTQSGVIAGTPMYMSPEQARGEQFDPRSDLFSLGSVLYAMCTGHAPFRASGTMAVMKRVIEDSPRSICEQHPEIPNWLEAIVFKLLAKNPGDRFQSAKDLAQLLEQHLAHLQQPSAVAMPAPVERPRKHTFRRSKPTPKRSSFPMWLIPVIALVLLAPCLLVFGLFIFGWLMPIQPGKPTYETDTMSIEPHGHEAMNEVTRPGLTVNLDNPGLRVVTVAEDGTTYEGKRNHLQVTFQQLPPGRYHARVYRPGKPDVLVAQQTFELHTPGSAFTFRAESGWTQLFNGQDLTGWKTFPEDRTSWKVVDGILTGKGAPSHLFSERGDYVNFHLRLETYLNKDSACGQFARVPFGDPGRLLSPFGDEELYKLDVPALYAKNAKPINPPPPKYRTNALSVWGVGKHGETWTRKPPGDGWFVQELIADGPNITVMLSGFKAYSAGWQGKATDGHIALQLFDADSVVRYRKIEIKELPAQARDEDRLQGSWHAVDGEFAGDKLTEKELKIAKVAFTGERMRGTFPPKGLVGEGSFTLNPTASPKQITVKASSDNNAAMEGIYRFEGERLILCMGGGADPRPKDFSSKEAKSYGLLVLERDPATPIADDKRLQGNWKIVAHEEGGEPLPAKLIPPPAIMSLSFDGDRAALKSSIPLKSGPKGEPRSAWEGVLHLDPTVNPKRMNVFIPGDNKNSMIGIYRFDGDRLVVCFTANPTKLDYPTAFATKKGDGLVMMTLEKFEAKDPAPFTLTPPKVLEHMVGSWNVEITQRTDPAQPSTKHVGHVVIEPVAGGRFNRMRTVTDNGGPDDLQLVGFDRDTWEFRGMYFDAKGVVLSDSVGKFDAASRTINSANQPELGVIRVRTTRFPNVDTIEYDVVHRNKDGKTVLERKAVMKRQKDRVDIDEKVFADLPKELSLLDRLVDAWDGEMASKLRPAEKWKMEIVGRKVLGGRFIETRDRQVPTGEENYALTTYDVQKKAFRQWYVSSRWPDAEGLASWDESTKTMTWDCEGGKGTPNDIRTTLVWKFASDDKTEFHIVVKDKKGKTLEELEGTHIRRAKSK